MSEPSALPPSTIAGQFDPVVFLETAAKLYSKLRKCRPGDATYCALSSAPNLYIKEVCVHPGNPLDARPGRIT
jgi:hypothetical protein